MTLHDGTNILSRNVVNSQSTLRNIPEERKSHFLIMVCDRWKQGAKSLKYSQVSCVSCLAVRAEIAS